MKRVHVLIITVALVLLLTVPCIGSGAVCPNPPQPTVTDFTVRQMPTLPEPAPRVSYIDPVFGTCVVRVTDRLADTTPGDPPGGLKNEYSMAQSFNVDDTRLVAMCTNGNWYLYDATTLQPLGKLDFGGDVSPRWDAHDPTILYYSSGTTLMRYDVATNEKAVAHDFANDFPGTHLEAVWSRSKGSPSMDGRYWGFVAQDANWESVAFLIYDLNTNSVIAKRAIPPTPDVNFVSVSPRGDYFIAGWNTECTQGIGDDAHPCGLMVYDHNIQNGRSFGSHVGHGDFALDTQGREVFVYQDTGTDYLTMADLASGTVTRLWSIDFSHFPSIDSIHISGRAFNRPGWALVSTSGGTPQSSTWMDDQVFAMELAPNGKVVRLAHDHTLIDEQQEHDYWAEPHGSVNRDFTKVLFTSNWGKSGTDQVEMYMVALPPTWTNPISPSAWQPLGGQLTSSPAAVSSGNGRIDTFARGNDGALWWKHLSGQDWSAWTSLGGYLTSDPAAVSRSAGRITVFVRGGSGSLWSKSTTDGGVTWSGWSEIGGQLLDGTGPAAYAWGDGRIGWLVTGTSHALWHMWDDSTGRHGWENLGGYLTSSPGAAAPTSGVIDVFVRGGTGGLWQTEYNNGWSGWTSLGGGIAPGTGPAVCSWGAGRVDVFVEGMSGALYHRWYASGAWSGWESLGGYLTSSPAATASGGNRVDVFVRGDDNGLWWNYVTNNVG